MSASEVRKWKRHTAATELHVPSGNIALVRRPDSIRVFLAQGSVPNMLLPIIEKALSGENGDSDGLDVDSITREAMADPEKLAGMIEMQDAIVVSCVIEPTVLPVPTYTEEHVKAGLVGQEKLGTVIPYGHTHREHGFWDGDGENTEGLPPLPLFVDEVDVNDKSHIFNFCMGGTADLERFREQQAGALERVAAVSRSEGPTE